MLIATKRIIKKLLFLQTDSQGQEEMFLAPMLTSYPETQSAQTTITHNGLRALGLRRSKIKWTATYMECKMHITMETELSL